MEMFLIILVCFYREHMPSLDAFFEDATDQLDPVNEVDEEYL